MQSDLPKTNASEIDSDSVVRLESVGTQVPEAQPLWVQALSMLAVAQILLTPAFLWVKGDGRFSWQMYSHPIQYRIKYTTRKPGLTDQSPAPEVLLEQFRHLTGGHLHQYNYSAKALQSELRSFLNQRAAQLETPFHAVLSYREIGSETWIRVEIDSATPTSSRSSRTSRRND